MKKAILVVSFGTTHLDTLQSAIGATECKIKECFPEYEVRRAFTSRFVIKKLYDRDALVIDNEQQALEKLAQDGYREVIVQPLHVVAGEEYDKVKKLVAHYAHAGVFDRIVLGRPLLYYMGQEDRPDDYALAIKAVTGTLFALPSEGAAVVLMGHGGLHPANAAYAALQLKLLQAGADNVFIYTVDGYPSLRHVMDTLRKNTIRKVTLVPFMLVAGDHAKNDMAGEEPASAKSQLEQAGFSVTIRICGLGQLQAIQELYVQHILDSIG